MDGWNDMVVINSSVSELNRILKKTLSIEKYFDICFRYGIDVEGDNTGLTFEITSDRVEIASKYSLASVLGALLGIKVHRADGISSKRMAARITETDRPFVNLLKVDLFTPVGEDLNDLIILQDKFDATIGRRRASAAIGMFDFNKIKFPITYTNTNSSKVKFVPLGCDNPKIYTEIMSDTEQGRSYGHLVGKEAVVWKQADGSIFAMPPVINADHASVTKGTRSMFLDITGKDRWTVNSLTKALMFNMQFIGKVSLVKPIYSTKSIDTQISLKSPTFWLNEENILKLLGVRMSLKDAASILEAMDYTVQSGAGNLAVTPPFYRQDVIHQVDIIDDLLRYYGVDMIKPGPLPAHTFGSKLPGSNLIDNMRDILIGFGYQELDLNVLTNKKYQIYKTGIKVSAPVELVGIKSGEIDMARANLIPELLRFVSNNSRKKFPQDLFDIGFVMKKNKSDVVFKNELHLCIASCYTDSNLSDVRVVIERLLSDSFGKHQVTIRKDQSVDGFREMFISERFGAVYYGDVKVGVIGEIHPRVLNAFGIEVPISAAEIWLDAFGL